MSIVTEFNYGYSTEQFVEYVDLLFYLAKRSETTAAERIAKVAQLTEAYFECRGKHADGTQLGRLASLILRDELTDRNEYKMSHNDYPIMSDRQQERRYVSEVSEKWSANVGQDGRDHQPKTRIYARKLREISR